MTQFVKGVSSSSILHSLVPRGWPDQCLGTIHSKKERVTLTLLGLLQLQLNDTMWVFVYPIPFIQFDSMHMCAMCRVSPECNQSNICNGKNLTFDGKQSLTVLRNVAARSWSVDQMIAIYSIPQSSTFLEGYPTHFQRSLYHVSARFSESKHATEVTILSG